MTFIRITHIRMTLIRMALIRMGVVLLDALVMIAILMYVIEIRIILLTFILRNVNQMGVVPLSVVLAFDVLTQVPASFDRLDGMTCLRGQFSCLRMSLSVF